MAEIPKKSTKIKARKYANLEEAAGHCDVSVPTLRNTINRYPDFPVFKRGNRIDPWKIDLDAVDEWRQRTGLLLKERVDPDESPYHRKTTGTRKKDQIQADLLQLDLDFKLSKAIDREATVKSLKTAFAKFAKGLDMIPTMVGKKLGFTNEAIEALRKAMDERRNALVDEMDAYFAQSQSITPDENAEIISA